MKEKQLSAVLSTLENIDRTKQVPELSGVIGDFFRDYARHRLDIANLTLADGMRPRIDRSIDGNTLGDITLRIVDRVTQWDEISTDFGVLTSVFGLCDELLSPVTLRLWSTTGGGAEGLHHLVNRRLTDQGIRLTGNYRWRPPNTILPNEANFHAVDVSGSPPWRDAFYIYAVGEDIGLNPHPLDYLPLRTSTGHHFAAVRIVAGRFGRDEFLVPFATRPGVYRLSVRAGGTASLDRAQTPDGRALGLASALVAREPDARQWEVLDAVAASAEDVVMHAVIWRDYLSRLDGSLRLPSEQFIESTVFDAIGVAEGSSTELPLTSAIHSMNVDTLQARIAAQIRIRASRTGTHHLGDAS